MATKDGLLRLHSCVILLAIYLRLAHGCSMRFNSPFHKALLTGKTKHASWRSKPSFYAVSTEDRTINPDLERFMAKRMGAKTIEVRQATSP